MVVSSQKFDLAQRTSKTIRPANNRELDTRYELNGRWQPTNQTEADDTTPSEMHSNLEYYLFN
jgi:hypothetical protein